MSNNSLKNKKIVILVISDFFHDARVLKEAQSAQKAGMKVTILTKKTPESKFIEKRNGYKIIRVETFIDKYIFPLYFKFFKKTVAKKSINFSVDKKMNLVESLGNVVNFWLSNRLFVKKALSINPDIIHANDPVTLPAAYKLKKLFSSKIIYDSHELYLKLLKFPHPIWLKYFSFVEKKINFVDGILSVNSYILSELSRRYNISGIPQALVLNSPLYQKISYKKPAKKIRLIYLGKIDAQRGVLQFAKVIKNIKNIEFSVLGNNLSEYGINSLPMVAPEKVVKVVSDYDIGILPFVNCSQSVYHSLPNKLFEYMMGGLAIASADLPEIHRIVQENQNGVLFNSQDSKDIIKKIKYLSNHPKVLAQYKKNSLKAAKKYCWENQEKKLLGLYEKVLER